MTQEEAEGPLGATGEGSWTLFWVSLTFAPGKHQVAGALGQTVSGPRPDVPVLRGPRSFSYSSLEL